MLSETKHMTVKRTQSIDVFRAVTMFLMIFVNDAASLKQIPDWIKHTAAQDDGMGLSDVVFPLFLFIVGLSIPLAINTRRSQGVGEFNIAKHVFFRTVALVVMGIFMVNISKLNASLMPINKPIWQILMVVGIMLIWLHYKPIKLLTKTGKIVLKCLGVGLLLYLAMVFKGGTAENPVWIRSYWWGILGLIGWSYCFNACFYMLFGNKITHIVLAILLLFLFNVQEFEYFKSLPSFKIMVSASNHLLVMFGMLCSVILLKFKRQHSENTFLITSTVIGLFLVAVGLIIRPIFIISKILATPSWTLICGGIAFLMMVLFYILIEKWKLQNWFKVLKPAGTSTLTCYIIPFLIYPVLTLLNFKWPEFVVSGVIGLIKSILFALVIVTITGGLEKLKIKLKI